MNYDNNRQTAHNEIDHIFKDLLPTRNMAERPAQVALCHQMLNAMLEGGIALCDAGTGIGKTYAYLVAGTVYSGSGPPRPSSFLLPALLFKRQYGMNTCPFCPIC